MIALLAMKDRIQTWTLEQTLDGLRLLRQHRNVSIAGFFIGAAAFAALGILWPKQYSGTALIALNSHLEANDPKRPAVADLLRQTAAAQDWASILTRFQLYPDLVANSGTARAAAYLASQVSVEEVGGTDTSTAAVRIAYTGPDRRAVIGVTDAVANGFAGTVSFRTEHLAKAPRTPLASTPGPLYAPVVLPAVQEREKPAISGPEKAGRHGKHDDQTAASAALARKLQASLAEGAKLQQALGQNALTLDELGRQQARIESSQSQAVAPTPKSAPPKPDPQEERLHQELAKAQRTLADLRERYTEEYPDVVAAKDRVRDLELDASRLAAVAARQVRQETKPAVETKPAGTADAGAIAAQIAQAQAAQNRLREAIEQNRTQTNRLQGEIAAASHSGADPASSNPAAPDENPGALNSQVAASPSNLPPNGSSPGPPVPDTAISATPSPFFLLQQATVTTHPVIFDRRFLLPLSLLIGFFAALLAAWLSERRHPSIRNEDMLRHELPPSAAYLGGIPRIPHEVIAD
jgi:hypothetical protein